LDIFVERQAAARNQEVYVRRAQTFQEAIEKLPPQLREQVGAYPMPENWAESMTMIQGQIAVRERYDFLVDGRAVLNALSTGGDLSRAFGLSQSLRVVPFWNEENKLDFEYAPLAQIVRHVEKHRIGKCPICAKFYWAERIDQPTCSTRCNNRRRSRIQRGTYVEERPHLLKESISKR